jgi:hypothetical protein
VKGKNIPAVSGLIVSASPQSGSKSLVSIALIRITSRRIPASLSANQRPEKGDLISLCWLVVDSTRELERLEVNPGTHPIETSLD